MFYKLDANYLQKYHNKQSIDTNTNTNIWIKYGENKWSPWEVILRVSTKQHEQKGEK